MKEKEEIFKDTYHSNYDKVMRICLGYVEGNNDEASDLTQEVFIKVWDNLDEFRNDSKISTWIYRITVNTCLTRLRKLKKKVKNYDVESVANVPQEDLKVDKEKMYEGLYGCINKLSETNRAIILLELEGLPQKEIAVVIGIKHEAIRTRIHRIKNELTKCVNNE
ncbi:RNA polymerase sigma factor [Croceitalea sp. MTPC9]|uniref:RNA polymerase sigma factor n=1 Tax=unclassified Croceitalea TaxID=2632280 RepID=UPI002B3EC6D2|nr:RNA polymerase sigma factor [Croceitalea sp. MTPC6]GMN16550.1 RNA polymerase sigma factor [Croceitalea sp. MTPC9]